MMPDCIHIYSYRCLILRCAPRISLQDLCDRGLFLFCDDVFVPSSSKAALACVLFDRSLLVIDGVAKCVLASSAFLADALAVRGVLVSSN